LFREGFRQQRVGACSVVHVAGDQLPQPYPIIDVHVPERQWFSFMVAQGSCFDGMVVLLTAMMGPSEKELVAAEQFYHRDMLEHIGKRQADYEQLLARTAQAFAVKVEVGSMCLACDCGSLVGEHVGINARK
jgi:hypothetical protein